MKKNTVLAFAVSLLALSCVQHQDFPVNEANPDAVAFSAAIMPSTRATDISFEDGDQISLYASEKGSLYSSNYAQNVKYTYMDGLFTTSEGLNYPDMNTTLSFYAIYPYGSYTTPEFYFAVNQDQSTHEAYTESDLMTASNTGRDQDVVDLVFNHNLTKVIINLSSDNLPAGQQSVVFRDVYHEVKADLSSNTYKYTGNTADIIASPNGTNSFKVILPPQTIERGDLFVEITIGGNRYAWEVESDLILSSGVEYVYNLALQENSVMFTSNINPWNAPSEMESVIPQEYLDLMSPYIPIYEGTTPPVIEGIYYISPNLTYYDSDNYYSEKAPDHVWFYDQSSDNTLCMQSTQNIGDHSIAEGIFISGSGNNFTVYFNEYSTYEGGAWLVTATLISGTKSGNYIKNYRKAFVVLDDYDPNDEYMNVGDFRVLEDGDYLSEPVSWPLSTKSARASGELNYSKK